MAKKQKQVSAAVSAVVTPAAVAPAVAAPVAVVAAYVVPDGEVTRALGVRAASADDARAEILLALMGLLKDQPYPVWDLVRAGFCGGAQSVGYKDPPKLWERYAIKPLAELGISKPVSEKSSAAREVKPETAAKQAAVKAERERIAAMSVAELDKAIGVAADDATKAVLLTAKVKKIKTDKAAADKAVSDALKTLRTSCIEIIKAAPDKATLQKMHTALAKCIPATPLKK